MSCSARQPAHQREHRLGNLVPQWRVVQIGMIDTEGRRLEPIDQAIKGITGELADLTLAAADQM